MGIMKLWKRNSDEKNSNMNVSEDPSMESQEMKNSEIAAPFDYGIATINRWLRSEDYGWSDLKPCKKVILVNPRDCENKITLPSLIAKWKGTGYVEWEALLSFLFITDVVDAIEADQSEADITDLFNHDLLARGDRVFTQEDITRHLMPWFEVVEESDTELRLKFKIA